MDSRKDQVATEIERSRLQRLAGGVASIRPRQVAIPVGVGIMVLVIFGILQRTAYPHWSLANLDAESSIATFFSATLLWAAAACWALIAAIERPRHAPTFGWALLLALIALDEGNAFHEALERTSGVDWQLLYLPILALGGLMWWRVVNRYGRSPTTTLLVFGAVAWAITLVLELVQNWGGPPVGAAFYNPTMIIEEGLEMVGSTLMLLAGMASLRAGHSS